MSASFAPVAETSESLSAVESDTIDDVEETSPLMGLVSLTGTKIVNYEHETLGTVADLMFDLDNGRVSYAVMTSGGFLGLGEKHFAIPWGVLEIDRERRCLVLDADAATFHRSPGFNPGRWSDSQPSDGSWQARLNLHYRPKAGSADGANEP